MWYDQQFRNPLLYDPHHWLCPLASSPHGHKKAARVPMSPVDMTISRGRKGPFPLVSFSWEPGTPSLQPPRRPPLLLHWPEPGHVPLLSQSPSGKPLGTGAIGRQPARTRGSHSLTMRGCGGHLWMELGNGERLWHVWIKQGEMLKK